MRRHLLAALLSVAVVAVPLAARAAPDPDASPSPSHLAAQLANSQYAMAVARAEGDALRAEAVPEDVVAQLSWQMQVAAADFRFRQGIRDEQPIVYGMAVDPELEHAVMSRLAPARTAGLEAVIGGLRSLWRSAGIDDLTQIHVRNGRRYLDSAPVDTLLGLYREAGGHYSVEWPYLASINFIESDFGRINGPSSAGALGPMQFMPATWANYGYGGDIMSPHDSIWAAAYYLNRMGAQADMSRAIFRYNYDWDYVAAVQGFAQAIREDDSWLPRLYYWSTFG